MGIVSKPKWRATMDTITVALAPATFMSGQDVSLLAVKSFTGYVGERKNYNLQPTFTEYRLWPASTIEWIPDKNQFKARVLLEHIATKNIVALNSCHGALCDAERAIDLVGESFKDTASRHVYNVFGETIEIHTSPSVPDSFHYVTEVLALIWSMM